MRHFFLSFDLNAVGCCSGGVVSRGLAFAVLTIFAAYLHAATTNDIDNDGSVNVVAANSSCSSSSGLFLFVVIIVIVIVVALVTLGLIVFKECE